MTVNVDETGGRLEAKSRCFESTRKSKVTYQHRTATHYDAPRANPSIVLPSQFSGTPTHLCTGVGSLSTPPPGPFPVDPNTRVTHGSDRLNASHIGHCLPPSPRPRPAPLRAVSPHPSSTETLLHSDSQKVIFDNDASTGKDEDTHYSKRKREFAVAFTPDTVDSSPWGGERRPGKRVRPPTLPTYDAENVEDNEVSDQFLDAVPPPELNPLEPPPQKEPPPSVAPNRFVTEEVEDEDGEGPSDVFIVITSPTGQRRVWGVSETLATQVSQMLDHKPDELLVGHVHERGQSPSPFTAGKKRQSEAAPEEQGRSNLLKKINGLFSRFLG